MKIEAGAILVIETGEYSDYAFTGPFKVLVAFDQAEVSEKYRSEWKGEYDFETGPQPSDFVPWLTVNGYIEDLPAHSWYVGSYGKFSPEIQDAA